MSENKKTGKVMLKEASLENIPADQEPKQGSQKKGENFFVSLINFGLAIGISFVIFGLVFLLMFSFARNQPVPDSLATVLSQTDWFFWVSLLVSLVTTGLLLSVADKVSEKKGQYTKGIPTAIILIIFIFTTSYYFVFRSDKDLRYSVQSLDMMYDNPWKESKETYLFDLSSNEFSKYFLYPEGYSIKIYGTHGSWETHMENIGVYVSRPGRYDKLPSPGKTVRVRIKSLVPKQIVFVYLKKL